MLFKQPSSRMPGEEDDNALIWSPAIKQAIEDWYTAKHDHDEDGLKDAARDMINATAAYHRAGGVPLFAHLPLPPQFVEAELGGVHALPQEHANRVVDAFIGKFDDSSKPIVSQQVAATLSHPPSSSTVSATGKASPGASESSAFDSVSRDAESFLNPTPFSKIAPHVWPVDDVGTKQPGSIQDLMSHVLQRESANGASTDREDRGHLSYDGSASSAGPRSSVGGRNGRRPSDITVQATTIYDDDMYEGRDYKGHLIRRNFRLSRPSDPRRGGYVVQTVHLVIQNIGPDGRPVGPPRTLEWSEAWRVSPGKDRPLEGAQGYPQWGVPRGNDSIGGPAQPADQMSGTATVTVTTRFYDGMDFLPDDFKRNSVKFAGALYATATPIDQIEFDGDPGPASVKSFPPILLRKEGYRR